MIGCMDQIDRKLAGWLGEWVDKWMLMNGKMMDG